MLQLFNASPHYHCITLPYESVLHYHFTLLKYVQLLTLSIDGLFIAFLTTLTAPYIHEKRLNGSLYHNQRKPLKNALKRVTSLCLFYRTQNLFHIMSVASCRCAFYAVYSTYLQAIINPLIYSYTNCLNTLKKQNTRLL